MQKYKLIDESQRRKGLTKKTYGLPLHSESSYFFITYLPSQHSRVREMRFGLIHENPLKVILLPTLPQFHAICGDLFDKGSRTQVPEDPFAVRDPRNALKFLL